MPSSSSASSASASSVPLRGWVFMALLALQFGLQPLFSKRHVSPGADKVPLVLLCELLKMCVACTLLVTEGGAEGQRALSRWRLRDALSGGAVPAAIYAVQNVCIQIGMQHCTGLLFNLLNQTKIIFTAVMVYAFMGRRQSRAQVVALTMVLVVGVVLSLPDDFSEGAAGNARDAAADDGVAGAYFWYGIVPTLAAAVLSGFASGWSQRVMQGKARRHAYLFSAELSLFSSLFLLGKMLHSGGGSFGSVRLRIEALITSNPSVWIPLATNAVGGIFVGQVIKYAGGVRKSFSVIVGIITTGLAEWMWFGEALSPKIGVCVPIVVVAMYVYATNPPAKAPAKPKGE